MAKFAKFVLLVSALALPASAIAQSLGPDGRPLVNDRRVGVGLSIPLGGPSAARGKPQLELRSSVAGDANERFLRPRGETSSFRQPDRETRIGFTLEAHPRLTIAGREMPKSDHKLGISTIALVGIAILSGAVVAGLILEDAINDASE